MATVRNVVFFKGQWTTPGHSGEIHLEVDGLYAEGLALYSRGRTLACWDGKAWVVLEGSYRGERFDGWSLGTITSY